VIGETGRDWHHWHIVASRRDPCVEEGVQLSWFWSLWAQTRGTDQVEPCFWECSEVLQVLEKLQTVFNCCYRRELPICWHRNRKPTGSQQEAIIWRRCCSLPNSYPCFPRLVRPSCSAWDSPSHGLVNISRAKAMAIRGLTHLIPLIILPSVITVLHCWVPKVCKELFSSCIQRGGWINPS